MALLAASLLVLAGGYALKAPCAAGPRWTGEQYRQLCYNDIQPLYESRQIDRHTFPYIGGYLLGGQLGGGGIEYPVATGLFMWASGYLADDPNAYLRVTALLLAPFALLITWLLARIAALRAFLWAAAPSLVLYAFHNWDLLVVAAAVVGIYLWWTGRYSGAAIAFGIGGALKLYPLLLLAPLFLDRWATGDRVKAWRTAWWGLGTTLAINLPIMYLNPPSWWLTYRFHSIRAPNPDSLWGQLAPGLDPSILNLLTTGLTGVTCGAVLWWGYRRAKREGVFPFVQIGGAVVAAFIVWSKVQSPQYMLWLLPFFVLLRIRAWWWVIAMAIDVAAYVSVFRYLYDLNYGEAPADVARMVMTVTAYVRAAVWGALVVVFARADGAMTQSGTTQKVSQPVPTLSPSEA